ncbi:MAG TPA: XamI family restriction endonuclease [Thermoanaerobaculia bacterium]|nr:XamI family restriction endonuclease [Thermoanaerobaculia bacterium]
MAGARKPFVPPPRWDDERLEKDRRDSTAQFRAYRISEPLADYLRQFDEAQSEFQKLLAETADLAALGERAIEVLTNPSTLNAVRYLAGPPISLDDLKVLADATLSKKDLRADPEMALRILETVLIGLDVKRFPWLQDSRAPTPAERSAAILASAALMATQRVATRRRNLSKEEQEGRVREALLARGLREVPRRIAAKLEDAPKAGEFCMESLLGSRKADLLVGLWDGRTLPIECKVSNSAVNSIKRLNNDAAAKARSWIAELGNLHVVPAAVLSGVFDRGSLKAAQDSGLTLFWAHDLEAAITWIEETREGPASFALSSPPLPRPAP